MKSDILPEDELPEDIATSVAGSACIGEDGTDVSFLMLAFRDGREVPHVVWMDKHAAAQALPIIQSYLAGYHGAIH